jgi:hypothetical protein
VYPGTALLKSSIARMTMVATHFRIIPMALTLPFERLRQYFCYDTHNLTAIASIEPWEYTSSERRLDVVKAGAPHTASLSPDDDACQFPGGVWANHLYVPLSIPSLFPSDVEQG